MDRFIEFATHHPALVGGAVLLALIVIAYEFRSRQEAAGSVTAQDAVRLMNQGALVLDIRTKELFDASHLTGARNIPAAQLEEQAESLKKYREKPVVVYCESGSLVASAIRRLAAKGFTKAVGLRGGLAAWRAENLPVTRT